jgi:hypothetical protein
MAGVSSLFDGGLPCGLVAVHAPLQWGLGCLLGGTPAAAGATPAINSAGHVSQQRQEETEQEGERGQSPTHRGLIT